MRAQLTVMKISVILKFAYEKLCFRQMSCDAKKECDNRCFTRGKFPPVMQKGRYVLFSSDVKEWDKGKRLQFWWCKRVGQGKTTSILVE